MATLVERDFTGTVNIGTEETVTLRELVETICRLSGRNPNLRVDPTKPEGRRIKSADATLLRTACGGFVPQVTLEQGLRRMMSWYQATFSGDHDNATSRRGQ